MVKMSPLKVFALVALICAILSYVVAGPLLLIAVILICFGLILG